MEIRVLGCYGNSINGFKTTSYLINDSLLIDAGAVTEFLNDDQLRKIRHILVTHSHLDHIKDLVFIVDELVMMGEFNIDLISVKQILSIISDDLFNNRLWPDFTVIPSKQNAIIKLREIELEKYTEINGITVKPILMTHTVYTVGYVVKEENRGFMLTSDTGPTKRFWEVARQEEGIEFIIADVSFPNRMESLAKLSGHMTMSMLIEHLERYDLGKMPIYINHMKPVFIDEILDELTLTKRDNIKTLQQGVTIKL
ncbi:MAG TPA: 3',5'-cyclic-nucleotide phosphodiesterase [Syntrophorhabdaceae bacterium]|nr:3',5'-cyclic-nucleotide phosphodiesterase [Syntrophorhabdaceae bacterium]